tara:strand:- start:988 stop:1599 length:612 start_codon:yes stop_codon:yes gene_type:complete
VAASFNLGDLDVFAQALKRAPEAANQAADLALQAGAEFALREGRASIFKELNLEKAYVHKQMSITKRSSRGDLLTKITAQRRSVLAPRFGAAQKTAPTKSPLSKVKGDPYRRIPKGRKAAGSTAWGPKRGGEKKAWPNAFFIWGKNSGAYIMLVRKGRGANAKLAAVYGSSVDEAWRGVRLRIAPKAMDIAVKRFKKEFRRRA